MMWRKDPQTNMIQVAGFLSSAIVDVFSGWKNPPFEEFCLMF